MNLTEYLKFTGEKPYKFADGIPVSRPLIYDLLQMEQGKDHRRISLEFALKLKDASGGLIDLECLGKSGSK